LFRDYLRRAGDHNLPARRGPQGLEQIIRLGKGKAGKTTGAKQFQILLRERNTSFAVQLVDDLASQFPAVPAGRGLYILSNSAMISFFARASSRSVKPSSWAWREWC